MLSKRQQTIEIICKEINDSSISENRDKARKLLNELISNRITEEEALIRLSDYNKYWKSVNLPKSLYDNLKKFRKSELTNIQKTKLVSSIVTRCLIEIEYHPDLNPELTGIYEFLDYLNYLLNKSTKSYEEQTLTELLIKYGFISKEVI